MSHVERVFVELIEFVETASDGKVLLKVTDVSQFISRTFNQLEKMAMNGV